MLLTRLRRYEDLLRGFGVKIETSDADVVARRVQGMEIVSDGRTTHNRDTSFRMDGKQTRPKGQMIVKNGKARYLEK